MVRSFVGESRFSKFCCTLYKNYVNIIRQQENLLLKNGMTIRNPKTKIYMKTNIDKLQKHKEQNSRVSFLLLVLIMKLFLVSYVQQ